MNLCRKRAVVFISIAHLFAFFLTFSSWASLFSLEENRSELKDSLAVPPAPPPPPQQDAVLHSPTRDVARRPFTPPPRPFSERKTLWAHERPSNVKAFVQKGFERVSDHKEAIFFCFHWGWGADAPKFKPWQRPNFTPGKDWMVAKDSFLEVLERGGTELPFFPESYRLCDGNSRKNFLRRLATGGMNQAWVMKVSKSAYSRGITFIGPNSPDLAKLKATLNSQRGLRWLCRRKQVIQKYVTNLLTYQGRKCHLRAFFPVVSVENPLLVYYHDGHLHSSPLQYNETEFTENKEQHFSTTIREWDDGLAPSTLKKLCEAEVSYEDFGRYLRTYVDEEAPHLRDAIPNPLAHVRSQMKAQMARLVREFRDVSFTVSGFPPENAYVLIGNDFFVDKDLNVILIESNWFPDVNRTVCPAINETVSSMLPEMVDLVSEVYEKQLKGEEVLPLKKLNRFELVYTDYR